MPQGLVLGPVLFLIFINDLPDNIRSPVRLFADDCVLYRNIHSFQDCLILQEDLTSLGQWGADWQMKFKVAKCHSMRVTRHQHHKQILFDYSLYHQTLENVQLAKCLGITVTDNIDWGQHVSDVSSKATKTLGFLRRNLAFTPRSTKEVAYKTLVLPKLEYAAPIWSPHSKLQVNQIEKVQRKTACWTGDGERRVVSAKCLMSLNGHLLRPGGTSPLCFSFTRFIVEQCLLKQTSI